MKIVCIITLCFVSLLHSSSYAQIASLRILDSIAPESIFPFELRCDSDKDFRIPELSYRFDRKGDYLWLFDGNLIVKYDCKNKKILMTKSVNHFSNETEIIRIVPGDSIICIIEIENNVTIDKEINSVHRFLFYDYDLNEIKKKGFELVNFAFLEMPWESSAYNYEYFYETLGDYFFIDTENSICRISKEKKIFLPSGIDLLYSYSGNFFYSMTKADTNLNIKIELKDYLLKKDNKFLHFGYLLNDKTYLNYSVYKKKNILIFYDLEKLNQFSSYNLGEFILPRAFQYQKSVISYVKSSKMSFLYNNRPFKRNEKGKNYIYQFEMPKR